MIEFIQTNIVTDNRRRLADFYINVFGCKPLQPERNLKGAWLDGLNSIKNAHITGVHLVLPGYEGNKPTLEIFQYDSNIQNNSPTTNLKGYGHIAF